MNKYTSRQANTNKTHFPSVFSINVSVNLVSNSVIFLKKSLIQVICHTVVFQKDVEKEQCGFCRRSDACGWQLETTTHSCHSQTGHQRLGLESYFW